MATLRGQFSSWRARLRVRKALKQSRGAERREFVYLDEVSVYSLITSRLGALTAELTDSQSATLTTETGADVEIALPHAVKAKATSKVQGSRTRATQVLRKATVQSTFKQLLEVEEPIIAPPPLEESAPFVSLASMKSELQRNRGEPWLFESSRLGRGELVEVLVEVAVDPVYRVSSIVDAMSELLDEYPAMVSPAQRAQFEQARIMNRILDKFMVGLVPLRCRVVDYRCVEIDGKEVVVHLRALEGLPPAERPSTKELFIVGVTDEQLYWKDLRRILFSDSRFTVLCRIDRQGVRTSWTPVKLADVLDVAIPDLPGQMEAMGQSALEAMASATSITSSSRAERQRRVALEEYGRLLAANKATALSESVLSAIRVAAEIGASQFQSVDQRRAVFHEVRMIVENDLGVSFDQTVAADFRSESLASVGLTADGSLSTAPVLAPPSQNNGPRRFIDTEIIAIYW